MPQFCILFYANYTLLATQRGGHGPMAPPKYAPDCCPSSSISCTPQSFFLQPVTDKQIAYHSFGFDCSKSTGIKGIFIKCIKLAESFLILILSKLFNASIKQGSFPTVFKTAKAVAVFKSG